MIINLLVGLCIALLVLFIWWFPKWQAKKTKNLKKGEEWQAENEFRKTLIQIVGGLIIITGIFLSWEEFKQSRVEFRQSQENIKSGQISSRFSQAIKLLSEERTTSRIGAIYALEQIVKESSNNYLKTVLDVLITFVRDFEYAKYQGKNEKVAVILEKVNKELEEIDKKKIYNSQKNKEKVSIIDNIKIFPEFQAALTVICRIRYEVLKKNEPELTRKKEYLEDRMLSYKISNEIHTDNFKKIESELRQCKIKLRNKLRSYRINLSGTRLINSVLRGAELTGADFRGTDLRWADISESTLMEANFMRADLRWTNLEGADFLWANLRGANLRGANLSGSNLTQANLQKAFGPTVLEVWYVDLTGAKISNACLKGAMLFYATLRKADLSQSNLTEAFLTEADLRESNLWCYSNS
ncbi:MAG: pentapeptide repeat-containing protein [Candidatus Aminicenantes bacterium]|nr:pentapeptide repeat-containing protein [Candidatus Aminicenantes bacterium]